VVKGTNSASRLWLARRMATMLAGAPPGQRIHVVADAACAGKELQKLPPGVTWTTRLRKDAALYQLPPARTGRRGRPRARGDRLPSLAKLAADAAFAPVTVTRYGKTATVHAAMITCLWYTVFGARRARVILIRDVRTTGYDLALVTTDPDASPAQAIERYAARWSIEVALEDARQAFGCGQARNRAADAVRRTVPFQLACQAIATCWYTTTGHDPADIDGLRARAPWYATKTQPSTADMAAKLRRVPIAARFKASRPDQPTLEEISPSAWPGKTQRHNRESRVIWHPLERISGALTNALYGTGWLPDPARFNFVRAATRPVEDAVTKATSHLSSTLGPLFTIVIGAVLILVAVHFLGKLLKLLMVGRARDILTNAVGRNAYLAMASGTAVTVLTQSSTITTSVLVPFAGTGILTPAQIYPVTVGANLGTTFTTVFAAFAVVGQDAKIGLQAAFVHLLYNVFIAMPALIIILVGVL